MRARQAILWPTAFLLLSIALAAPRFSDAQGRHTRTHSTHVTSNKSSLAGLATPRVFRFEHSLLPANLVSVQTGVTLPTIFSDNIIIFETTDIVSTSDSAEEIDVSRIEQSLPSSISTSAGVVQTQLHALDLTSPDHCTTQDTVITLRNNLRDTLSLTSLLFADGSAFSFRQAAASDDHSAPASITLPVQLLPGAQLSIPVRMKAQASGYFYSELRATLVVREQVVSVALPLRVHVIRDLPFVADLSITTGGLDNDGATSGALLSPSANANYDLGQISACESKTVTFEIHNPMCDPIIAHKLQWKTQNPRFRLEVVTDPTAMIAAGSSTKFRIIFTPSIAIKTSAELLVTLVQASGIKHDTTLTFTAEGLAPYAAELSRTNIDLDTILFCDKPEETFYLRNNTCDSVKLLSAEVSEENGFKIVEPRAPRWLLKKDSVLVRVALDPIHAGQIQDSIVMMLRSRDGEEHALRLDLDGFVRARRHSFTLSTESLALDSVKPCSTTDTVVVLFNTGICDTIRFSDISVSGSPWFTKGDAKLPKYLLPGAFLRIPITISVDPEGSATAALKIYGSNIDTTIALAASVHSGGRSLRFDESSGALTAKLCETTTHQFTVTNTGCVDVPLDSIFITSDVDFQTQFHFGTVPALPVMVHAGQSYPITVVFDADGNGDAKAELHVRSAVGGLTRDIHLTGRTLGRKASARIGLMAERGEQTATKSAGQLVSVAVVPMDDISDTIGFESISFGLRFDDDVLTRRTVEALNGWSIEPIQDTAGLLHLTLTRNKGGRVKAGEEIARVNYYTTIGDSTYSLVTLEQPRFNPKDPNFERCILSAISTDDTLRIDISLLSGDERQRRGAFTTKPGVSDLAIYPNPIISHPGKIAMAEVDFHLDQEGPVTMQLQDDLGRLVAVLLDANLYSGNHRIPIALPLSAVGNYFLSVESGAYRDVRKIIIRN
jgi:hypothetical protein